MSASYPKIRPLEIVPIQYGDEQMYLLRDPQQISDDQLVLPPILAQMTLYLDGLHDIPAIHRRLAADIGFDLPEGIIERALSQLDDAFMLDNGKFAGRMAALRAEFAALEVRPMTIAGHGYAADPAGLKAQFDEYAAGDDERELARWSAWNGRAVISPHIDYQRGGPVYARTWRRAENAVKEADLVLMFATDHNGGLGSVTLTQKPYATPYGVLPTDKELVDKLAAAIGENAAYELELNHRHEHAVELAAVWLHHVAGADPPPMVPLLIGSFHHFVMGEGHPDENEPINTLIETLQRETAGRKVLCVASVDLAHVGPAFGDEYTMDNGRREALWETDHSLMEAITHGDRRRWYDEIAAVQDANKVCGFSPVYLMMRYLGDGVSGTTIAYDQCEADSKGESVVSICGMLLD